MLDKADKAGLPAPLDCIGIYAKTCHDNGSSATIPPYPLEDDVKFYKLPEYLLPRVVTYSIMEARPLVHRM